MLLKYRIWFCSRAIAYVEPVFGFPAPPQQRDLNQDVVHLVLQCFPPPFNDLPYHAFRIFGQSPASSNNLE